MNIQLLHNYLLRECKQEAHSWVEPETHRVLALSLGVQFRKDWDI